MHGYNKSISANIPCTQETGIFKTNSDYFSDKVHTTTTTYVKVAWAKIILEFDLL